MISKITKSSFSLLTLLLLLNVATAQSIEYGDDLTANISSLGEIDTYTFNGNAGDVIWIRMRGQSLGVDGCFKLLSPSGTLLAEDCDDGGIVQVNSFTLNSTGTYSIVAQDHNDNDTGEYGISLERLNGASGISLVNCGEDVMASFDNWTEVDLYGLECAAGDQIMIQMRSVESNIECRFDLIDPAGNILMSETTQAGLASIPSFTVPADAQYTIAAYDKNGNDLGEYGIAFQLLNQAACATIIQMGATVTNSFNQIAQIDAYTLNCIAGDQLQISLTDLSGPLEPSLILCDVNGTEIQSEIDEETAKIEYTITASGVYNLIVRDDKGNDEGDYILTLDGASVSNIDKYLGCGEHTFTRALEAETDVHVYAFEAVKDEIVNIQARRDQIGLDAFIKVYDPQGQEIASHFAMGSLAAIQDLIIPADGQYIITVEDKNNNNIGTYGFSFQKVYIDICATQLDCSTSITSSMFENKAQMDVYEFDGEEGQAVTFIMEEIDPVIEPMIRLYAPDGTLLIEDTKAKHVDVTDYSLPQTGRYVIVCMDHFGNDKGAYELTFELNDTDGNSTCGTCSDGVQNGQETGVDCGGPDCGDCCPVAGLACDDGNPNTSNDVTDGDCGCAGEICASTNLDCVICPDDIVLNCSDLVSTSTSNLPIPIKVKGAGTYDMTITFTDNVEYNGACDFFSFSFDSGCIGVRTACFGKKVKLTPDYPTCLGPLPKLPFTITFNGTMEVYFDRDGNASVISGGGGGSSVTSSDQIVHWLGDDIDFNFCGLEIRTNNFDPTLFETICDPSNAGTEVSQEVTFNWIDLCGNENSCVRNITIVNDLDANDNNAMRSAVIPKKEIAIYPNPAVDYLQADLKEFIGENITMRVTDNYGQVIHKEEFQDLSQPVVPIDAGGSSFQNGLYYVVVTGQDGSTTTQTFMIVKSY